MVEGSPPPSFVTGMQAPVTPGIGNNHSQYGKGLSHGS